MVLNERWGYLDWMLGKIFTERVGEMLEWIAQRGWECPISGDF